MSWEQVYEQWIDSDKLDEKMRKELQDLGKDPELKKDAFYKQLEFGTAGMRGVLGPGVNRMNIFTIRQATEGLAESVPEQTVYIRRAGWSD